MIGSDKMTMTGQTLVIDSGRIFHRDDGRGVLRYF
jgi:hypothetical protein